MKLTYKIGDHDLDVRKSQAERWAKEWNPMKIMLQLRGRENQYEDLALGRIEEFIASLDGIYKKIQMVKYLNNEILSISSSIQKIIK